MKKNKALKKLDKFIAETKKETKSLHVPRVKKAAIKYSVSCYLKVGMHAYFNEFLFRAESKRQAKRKLKEYIRERHPKSSRIVPFSIKVMEYNL